MAPRLTLAVVVTALVLLAAGSGSALSTSGGKVDAYFKGICWFGFNNAYKMLSDLYAGNDSMTKDFRTVVWRIKSLGFNAVRIGFNFDTLYQGAYDKPYNMNCAKASPGALVASVTPPGGQGWNGQPPYVGGRCNEGIPDDSVYSRFLWAVDYIASQGLYVMVDFHNSGKANQVGDLAFRDVESFIKNWEKLVKDLNANPTVSGKLLVDLINEPDAYNIRWEAANGNPGLTDLYLRALDRLYPACPNCLFVIEGTGQSAAKANWGDGFITNQTTIKEFGGKVSDATPFFEAAVAKPWAKQAVLAPHIYCPSSSKAIDGFRGQEMYDRLDNSFGGKIRAPGYCNADGVCHQFAAIVGETSNNFWTGGQNERDCWNSLASYYGRGDFSGFFYWGWNSNSADTGGIVSSNNPRDIDWSKIDSLRQLGL